MPTTESVKPTTTYTFKYDSDDSSIDLNTLLVSQIHFSTILGELKNEIAPNTDLSIKIKPLEKGSVPFDIILNVSWIDNLLAAHNTAVQVVELGSAIVGGLVALIQIRIWLKGEKPANVITNNNNTTTITNNNNNTQITVNTNIYNIYTSNTVVDKAFKKAFEAIDSDEQVTGVEILDEKKKNLITVPKSDFENLTNNNEIFEEISKTESLKNQSLTVLKVIFEKGYRWQFYFESRKISAIIEDEEFMARINKGEPFSKGDQLIVDMDIKKGLDQTLNIYVEQNFVITKVHKHIPRGEQTQMELK